MVNTAAFTHLQVHSHYSLLQATADLPSLAARAASDGLRYLALTDTNALYGAVALARACQAENLQPIVGMTVSVRPLTDTVSLNEETPGQIVLLATGPEGYRSLCALSACLQAGPQREERLRQGLSWEELNTYRQGLLCLTGGRRGWSARYLRLGQAQLATRYASRLGAIFEEDCYLGIELHDRQDEAVARELVRIGERFGWRPVAMQPVYTLETADKERLRLLAAIEGNVRLADVPEAALPDSGDPAVDVHWLSPEEMETRFAAFPEALTAVSHITRRCKPALPDGKPIWPVLALPEEETAETRLTALSEAGLARKYGDDQAVGQARLKQELAVIQKQGFAPFFLVVADIVRFAREEKIPVSTRGSVANSLVAYCLDITTVDPLAHHLIFERFLNPARLNLPDIDLDFCSRRRDEVLHYIRQTYGAEQVALVATINRLQPKSAVRETGRAYGLAEASLKRLSALVPRHWHPDPRRRLEHDLEAIVAQLEDELEQTVMRAAFSISGLPHHLSLHPGGVVITPEPLTNFVPLQWTPKGFIATQYDYADLESIGLPKIDVLGIRALTVLAHTAALVRHDDTPHFRVEDIPLDDEVTGDMLMVGDTIGVFQCESTGAQRTLRQLRVRTVHDLAVANAFFKPGPATGGMAASFIRRYRGQETVQFLHPALEPILAFTQGVLLFQEQVLRIATEIAGLSWAQADYLRRGMSKFKAREMAAMRTRFVSGCRRPPASFSQEQAEALWQQIIAFAGYGFNQGHATAYADVTYRSAYLRAHWPAAFLCARLAEAGGFHHPAIYMAEAQRLGMVVRPPHVNVSDYAFTLQYEGERPVLWMGLSGIKGIGQATVKAIVQARGEMPFRDVRDFLDRVGLKQKEVKHLAQCGALDGLGPNRATLVAEAQAVLRAGNARQMVFDFGETLTAVAPDTPTERLQWEEKLLGVPLTVHPLALVTREVEAVSIRSLPQTGGELVTVLGTRLPGWTGGKGFYLGDGDDFVVLKHKQKGQIPLWQPLWVNGRWQQDEWGGGWLQAESIETVTADFVD